MSVSSEPAHWLALAYNCDLKLERVKAIVFAWCLSAGRPLSTLFSSLSEASQTIELTELEKKAIQHAGKQAPAWQQELSVLAEEGIQLILRSEPDYPAKMANSMPAAAQPLFLFVRGDKSLLNQVSLGVIGGTADNDDLETRGLELGALLAEEGMIVHTGLSQGVGKSVVEGALSTPGGRAIVTLPMGIRGINPDGAIEVGLDNGSLLVVSPFPPNAPFTGQRAEARYQLISRMSQGMLYFGDNETNVASDTAVMALEQGHFVWVWDDETQDSAIRQQVEKVTEAGGLPLTELSDILEMIEALIEQDLGVAVHEVLPEGPAPEAPEQVEPIDPQATLELLTQAGRVPESLTRRLRKRQTDNT